MWKKSKNTVSFFQFGILPEYLHILWMRNFVLLRVSMRAFGVHHRCGVGDIWYLPTPTSKWFLFPSTFKLNILKLIFLIFQMRRGDVREGMRRMAKKTLASNCELMLWFIKLRMGLVEVLLGFVSKVFLLDWRG